MDHYSLVEVAYMLNKVRSTIVNGKRWLIESLKKSCPFNLVRERRLGNLIQRPTHSVISQAFTRWTHIPTFMMVLLVIGEILTGQGS